MEIFFYFFFIIYLIFDFFLFCKRKKKIFGFHQLIFISLIFILNLFQIINSDFIFQKKFELILLSLIFSLSSYFAYLNIIAFLNRSGSFAILISYYKKRQNNLNIDEVFKINTRFEELKNKKFIIKKNERYVITKKGLIFLKLYEKCILFLKIKVIG